MAWGKGRAGPGHQSRGRGREGEGTGGLSRGPGERGGGRSSSVVAAGRASSWEGTGNLGEAGCGGRHVYVTAERAEKGPCSGPITRQGCWEPRAVPGSRAECRLPPRMSVLVRTVAPAASCPGVSRGPRARAGTGAAACWCHGVRVSLSCARQDQPVPCCTRKSSGLSPGTSRAGPSRHRTGLGAGALISGAGLAALVPREPWHCPEPFASLLCKPLKSRFTANQKRGQKKGIKLER